MPAAAQSVPTATVISPLKTQSDVNNVNIGNGRMRVDVPSLSVPAAPRLKFDNLQNAVPYVKANMSGSDADTMESSIAVHTGASSSESFRCVGDNCYNIKGQGAHIDGTYVYNGGPYHFTESQSGAFYAFGSAQFDNGAAQQSRQLWYYASSIAYPDGEVISFTYDKVQVSNSPLRVEHRLTRMSSNLGYQIDFEYETNTFNYSSWQYLRKATLKKTSSGAILGELTYNSSGQTIDPAGRTYTCSGCNNGIRSEVELSGVSMTLPGEGSGHLSVTPMTAPGLKSIVSSVVRDGVTWSYTYNNLRAKPAPADYTYDSLVVSGPNGYQMTYNINSVIGGGPNLVAASIDALGRATSYSYDINFRPTLITQPEGDSAQTDYDGFGNIASKVSSPKPGSGLSAITESTGIDAAACANNRVLCFRPSWYKDGLNRQTDYAYDAAGRLIQRTDPADTNGVRRATYLTYGGSYTAPVVVRVCGLGTTCGTSAEMRTEFTYLGNTALPLTQTQIDAATSTSLVTSYTYDDAGRLLSEDGPRPGSDDAKYLRYDTLGRKEWEIGPANAGGSRPATRYTYRAADDKVTVVETGTVPNAASTALTVMTRSDTSYDTRRNPVQVAVSASGTTHTVQSASYDHRGQPICSTVRMNLSSLPADACTPGTLGAHGPDRITRKLYDAAGQVLQVQKAYGTPLQQNYATYTYSGNGKQASITDAKGNLATFTYDGFDRLAKWTFPSKTIAGQVDAADYEAYGYDAVGNRLSLRKRDGVTLTYQYDGMNRNTLKSVPASASGAPGYSVHYGYDVRGLPVFARFGSATGPGVTNVHDGFGRLSSSMTTMGGVSRTLSYLHDAAGDRTRVTHPDGAWFGYAHDGARRLSTVGNGQAAGLAGLSYDGLGRRQQRVSGGTTDYGYDAIGRLTLLQESFTGGGGAINGFSYNPASQIVGRTRDNDAYAFSGYVSVNRAYAVNGLNQYASAGPASFSYDANGNLTGDGARTYVYDAENRLVSASNGLTMAYDPLGRLFQTGGAASGVTQFLYDGDALVAEYAGSSGPVLRRYVHGAGVDEPLIWYEGPAATPAAARHLKANHQGSIVALTDANGGQMAINSYDEYGIPSARNMGRFQYTGQAWIPELGMYHYKTRIYSPTLGRFLQTDPIGYEDQINLYAYVGNDPINGIDPSGMATDSPMAQSECQRGSSVCSGWSGSMEIKGGLQQPRQALPPDSRAGGSSASTPNSSSKGGTFVNPTNPPSEPPYTGKPGPAPRGGGLIGPGPNGTTIRTQPGSPATAQRGYSNGYHVMYKNGQQVDPSTGKPPSNMSSPEAAARTHTPLPADSPFNTGTNAESAPNIARSLLGLLGRAAGAVGCILFCESPAR